MLAEFLADQGGLDIGDARRPGLPVFPDERPGPLPLQLEHLHFETLFCLRGSVTLTRQDGSFLKAGAQQVRAPHGPRGLYRRQCGRAPWKAFWWQWMPGAPERA